MWLYFLNSTSVAFRTQHHSTFPVMPPFVLASPGRFMVSVLMRSIFPLNAASLALYCVAHLHLKRPVVDHRYQALIVITPLLNTHTVVYCSECLYPMCFSNLSSTQSPSQQQCYYCQQDRRGPIGVHCVWDMHYSWIRNYFHTFARFDLRKLESTTMMHVFFFSSFCMCASYYYHHGSQMCSLSSYLCHVPFRWKHFLSAIF